MRLLHRLTIAGIVVLAITAQTFAQEIAVSDPLALFDEKKVWYNGFTETWFQFFDIRESDVRSSLEHWESIGAELRDGNHDLRGTYTTAGETHGDYFRWAPKSGFVWLSVNKCMGGPMRILRGRVEVMRDGIVLVPEHSFGSSEGHGAHSGHSNRVELIAVRWLGGPFLVQKEHLSNFADYAAGLGEFNGYLGFIEGSPFLFKMGGFDSDSKPPSLVLPEEYKHLIKAPVRGKIVGVGKPRRIKSDDDSSTDELVTTLTVQLDGKTRPTKGMTFVAAVGTDQHLLAEKFVLKSVRGNRATMEYSRWTRKVGCVVTSDDDCKDLEHIVPKIGMIVSTNGY